IDGNTSLLGVSKRGAEFGPPGGPAAFTLQLPEPAAAETGTLTPAVSQPDQAQMQQPQRETATHVAQPPFPVRGGFQNAPALRGGQSQPAGGFQGPPGGAAPSRTASPPEQQNDGTLQQ